MAETTEAIEWVNKHSIETPSKNEHGSKVTRGFAPDISGDRCRYFYDFGMCSSDKGWKQYDTEQDASYFGIWVHVKERVILNYIEGDLILIECPSVNSLKSELDSMAKFYGDPPPAFTAIEFDNNNNVTGIIKYYDERPQA